MLMRRGKKAKSSSGKAFSSAATKMKKAKEEAEKETDDGCFRQAGNCSDVYLFLMLGVLGAMLLLVVVIMALLFVFVLFVVVGAVVRPVPLQRLCPDFRGSWLWWW